MKRVEAQNAFPLAGSLAREWLLQWEKNAIAPAQCPLKADGMRFFVSGFVGRAQNDLNILGVRLRTEGRGSEWPIV